MEYYYTVLPAWSYMYMPVACTRQFFLSTDLPSNSSAYRARLQQELRGDIPEYHRKESTKDRSCTCSRHGGYNRHILIYYYAWLCPWVRSSVRACVRACVRVKNGNGSRMRALPDAPSTCDQFTVTGQSTTCLYVKCEKMLALSSDYKT